MVGDLSMSPCPSRSYAEHGEAETETTREREGKTRRESERERKRGRERENESDRAMIDAIRRARRLGAVHCGSRAARGALVSTPYSPGGGRPTV